MGTAFYPQPIEVSRVFDFAGGCLKQRDLHPQFGTEFYDFDLQKPLQPQQIEILRNSLRDRKLILIRDQNLQPEQYIQFCSHFGTIWTTNDEMAAEKKYQYENFPELVRVSNRFGVLGKIELLFHADGSHHPRRPYPIRCLYAQNIPSDSGGETTWADMEWAYQALDPGDKIRFLNLSARHVPRYHVGWEQETVYHPLVRQHPLSGRKSLSVDEYFTVGLKEWPDHEAQPFLQKILKWAVQQENTYEHQWRTHDLVIFDNNNTVHRRNEIRGQDERLLLRITLDFAR